MSKKYTRYISILIALFFPVLVQAQDNTTLSAAVQYAHSAGILFKAQHLFNGVAGEKHLAILAEETLLAADVQAIAALYDERPQAVSLKLTTETGKIFELEMLQFDPLAKDVNIGYRDDKGMHQSSFDRGVHYQGSIKGFEKSLASISVFANGDVMALFANDEGNFVLGKLEDGSGKYVLYNDKDLKDRPYRPCGVNEAGYTAGGATHTGEKTTANNLACRKVRLYWEADYQLYLNRGDLTKTQNYLTGLFGQVKTLYYNERIVVELKSMYVWTKADPYIDSSSARGLATFKDAWNNKGDTFDGDLAHLITLDNKGNGGRGYLDILCSRKNAYAYSEIDGSYKTVPTYSWDVEVVTHETGHNLGSHHTHWCGWNQGPGGICGAIDSCTKIEADNNCTSCMHSFNNNSTTWKGTIMSYCHLVSSRGISLANGFGLLPGDYIRGQVNDANCLYFIDTCFPVSVPVINTSRNTSLKLYPNPANESVTVQFYAATQKPSLIRVTDMLGRVVLVKDVNYTMGEIRLELDISKWVKGVYFFSLIEEGIPAENIKLVVQ